MYRRLQANAFVCRLPLKFFSEAPACHAMPLIFRPAYYVGPGIFRQALVPAVIMHVFLLEVRITELFSPKVANGLLHKRGFSTHGHSDNRCTIWQYGLWSFQIGGTKLERFLPKNQHTQRKLLNFENLVK